MKSLTLEAFVDFFKMILALAFEIGLKLEKNTFRRRHFVHFFQKCRMGVLQFPK